jgi:signal transduction histidine kinase
MTTRPRMPSLLRSLSARLLALTVLFVMLSEVLIFAPSAGNFRLNYLLERSKAGYTAILALLATPNNMVSDELEAELLKQTDAYVIAMGRPDGAKLMLGDKPPPIDASFDLRERGFFMLIGDAFETLFQSHNRVLRIVAPSPRHPQATIEIVIDEAPMRMALIDYSYRILALSIVISLQWLLVRPMRRMTASMMAFRENPEDLSHQLPASTRTDELGVAQAELADMQAKLRAALQQKTRLAALGTAVTKINHDLRNILTTAQLVADRLAVSDNPEVKKMTPTLLAAIDRAVDLCSKTLTFAREGPPELNRQRFPLRNLIDEVGAALPAQVNGQQVWFADIAGDIEIEADRDMMFRVFSNLGQNALQAGATRVAVNVRRADSYLVIEVTDNGPGLPPRARENLFQPFAASARPGGSGLGLAIARDLMHAHGGDIRLTRSDAEGTVFELELPVER